MKEQLKGCVKEVISDFNYLSEETVLELLCDCLVECGKIDTATSEAIKAQTKAKAYKTLSGLIETPNLNWLTPVAKRHIITQMAVLG